MPPIATSATEIRMYRALLSLCPARFQREHGEEMARDFDEARHEAAAAGGGALWMLRLLMAVDLVRTFAIQWARSPSLPIAAAAMLVTLALVAGLASFVRATSVRMPIDPGEEEMLGILFLTVITVMLVATTIVLTQWVSRINRIDRRGRRQDSCSRRAG